MASYDNKLLNGSGLSYLWNKIVARFNLKQDKLTAGTGISITNNEISNTGLTSVPNATSTVVGGITVRLSGSTLYIRNDGQQA